MRRARPRSASRCALLSVLCAALSAPAFAARADDDKRPVPDYDGRGEPPATAEEMVLLVPKLLLSPLYLVSEYVIRQPLGFLVAGAERAGLPEVLYNFFAFGPDHSAGIVPIAFIDFGFDPSVGVYAFWNDAFAKHNDLRLRASTWGQDWIAGSITDRIGFGPQQAHTLSFRATFIRRPDYKYFGEGSNALESDLSRYGATTIEGGTEIDFLLWRASHLHGQVGVRSMDFRPGHYGDDLSVDERVAEGTFPMPAGYATGYTSIYNRLKLSIDTRQERPANGTGVRFEVEANQGSDVRSHPGGGWMRYGGSLSGFYDLTDHNRVVSLGAGVQFADPLGEEEVPFTELVTLGGAGPMRGFAPGRLVGRSAAVALLRYRWPIWNWLDGSIQVAVGNVFGAGLRGFELDLLRYSGAIGIESVGTPDSSLELLFGIGSETFEHGGQVTSIRAVLGSNNGF